MEIAGEGALLALLEKTKARLEAEGLFAAGKKRPLPFLPKVIGVVTSPTGAVIRDILHRLADRFPVHVLVWPVLVQGEGSAAQVAAALRGFSAIGPGGPVPRPDVVIVARGGGSIEDLWGFNEEIVVRAIAECTIPVISAVGHETDTTLADYAADRRAPTPTAAAEIAVPVRAELAATLDEFALRQKRAIARPVALGWERLEARVARLPRPETIAAQAAQNLDELGERLRRGLADRAQQAGNVLQLASVRLTPALVARPIREQCQRLKALERLRLQLNPKAPLRRGYVMVTDSVGHVVKTAAEGRKQASLTLDFEDGRLDVVPAGGKPPARKKPKRGDSEPGGQAELF
jgi:exodeoxyribonuclease VII large subunit